MNVERRQASAFQDQAKWQVVSPPVQAARVHPLSPFIIITQPESWYLFYRPTVVEGWVNLVGWLHTDLVYPSTDGHPLWY